MKRTIAGLRADNNMTQEDLAFKLGVTKDTVRRWEQQEDSGDLKPYQLFCIAYIFNVNHEDIKV